MARAFSREGMQPVSFVKQAPGTRRMSSGEGDKERKDFLSAKEYWQAGQVNVLKNSSC